MMLFVCANPPSLIWNVPLTVGLLLSVNVPEVVMLLNVSVPVIAPVPAKATVPVPPAMFPLVAVMLPPETMFRVLEPKESAPLASVRVVAVVVPANDAPLAFVSFNPVYVMALTVCPAAPA